MDGMIPRGERIGDWIVDEALGEGGMGTVYRAHSAFSELVTAALKVLKPSAELDARARFVREAEALAALRHPAIVRVLGVTEDLERGRLALALELAHGQTLRDRLLRGPMPVAEALGVFPPLAAALAHAHEAGVAHRDVKPANVVLCADGPRLVDFGIASSVDLETLKSSERMGTLGYMAPELFRSEPVEPRAADVYALGLILHEALTGHRVFVHEGSPSAVAASIVGRKLAQGELDPGPTVPERLRDLVRRATAPDPAARPSMAELRDGLAQLVERRGAVASGGDRLATTVSPPLLQADTDHTTVVPDPPSARAPWRAIGVALALLVAAAIAAYVLRPVKEGPRVTDDRPAASTPRRPTPHSPSAQPSEPEPELVREPAVERAPSTPEPTSIPPAPVERAAVDFPAQSVEPPDVSGVWMLENVVDRANRDEFLGLRLGYRLALRQLGNRVEGTGEKVTENGGRAARTRIELQGQWQARRLELSFTEAGELRTTRGRFTLRLSPEGELEGAFESGAARSSGRSKARRM
jgi:serine/threonine protein kinase